MRLNMASIAILCLLLMERFLTSDMDGITRPFIKGLRALEGAAYPLTKDIFPEDSPGSNEYMCRYFLFTPERRMDGIHLILDDPRTLHHFDPRLDTKVIIHGFLDKVQIADWMHHMKNEFLLLDNFNVIVVDWSSGNFLPYTKAATNTERVGEEISSLLALLRDEYGAKPNKFHLIGHSLGSHVAGHVGKRIPGVKRITGLDPATYLFSKHSPTNRLDRSDAEFVDVIHTDAGGIGMIEPVGHVDFYPNGGEVQNGCTASNSLRSLLRHGVVEGVRSMICSHMRAPLLFTDTINSHHCEMVTRRCEDWSSYTRGECWKCKDKTDCPEMGYHVDTTLRYQNESKYYLFTADSFPYCGYEYKIVLSREEEALGYEESERRQESEWSSSDILHVSIYGSEGNADFTIEKNTNDWQGSHVVFSNSFLGDALGGIIRWSRRPISRARDVIEAVSNVFPDDSNRPYIISMNVTPLKARTQWGILSPSVELCTSPALSSSRSQQGATFRNEYC